MIKVLNVQSFRASLYALVDYLKEHLNEKTYIIVPDKLSLFMEKFLFEKLNLTASFNIRLNTFNRFAKQSCQVDKEKQIGDVGSILLVNNILNEHAKDFKVLKSGTYSFSYAETIMRTIAQIKASKISWQEMENFESTNEQLQAKIHDLSLIYREYEEKKSGLLDASDVFLMSSMFVAKDRCEENIFFVGFDDFTAIEYSIIEQLAQKNYVNVFNYKSEKDNRYIYNFEVIEQLRNISYIGQIPFEIENVDVKGNGLKKYLQDELFSLKKSEFVLNDELVKIFAGNSISNQIEFVARDIRTKILEGQRYNNFGVAVWNLETNANKIKEIFSKYEINYYIDTQICINNSIFFKFLISVMKYNLESYNLCHLIDIINSPFCEFDEKFKSELVEKLLVNKFKGKIKSNFDVGLEDQEKFVEFAKLIDIDENLTVEDIKNKIDDIIIKLNCEQVLNNLSNSEHDLNGKILLQRSIEKINEIFAEILKFNKDLKLKDFLDCLIHIAEVVKIPNLPLCLDAVKIVDANNTLEIFDELYLVDCRRDNAPNLKYDCGVILDTEIEQLDFKNKLSPTIAHINKLAKLRLYNLVNSFENELTITYQDQPSEIVEELKRKLKVQSDLGKISITEIPNFPYGEYVALSRWDYIQALCKNDKKNLEIDKNMIENHQISCLNQENLKILDDMKQISASRLENYFRCPFYSFMNDTIKIKPREDSEIEAYDIGNILHEILFKYYKRDKKVGDIYEFVKQEVYSYAEKLDRLKINLGSPILKNLIDEAMRVIEGVNYIDNNSNFVPNKNMLEFAFCQDNALKLSNIDIIGKIDRVDCLNDLIRVVDYKSGRVNGSLKELYLGTKLQLFLYACAIEQITGKNVVGTFYLPLHNKYSRQSENPYAMSGYFLAEDFVAHALDKRLQAGEKSDIINLSLKNDGMVKKTAGQKELDSADFLAMKNYAKKVSENAVEEIRSGYIKPSPIDINEHCDTCPYEQICLHSCCNNELRMAKSVNKDSFKEDKDE